MRAGVQRGDVITKINDLTIDSPQDVNEALESGDLAAGLKVHIVNKEGSRVVFLRSEE